MTVRVTLGENKAIEQVEVLKQTETSIGQKAIQTLPNKMVEANTYEVDSVTGASATSRALKEAVKKAIESAE